MYEVLALLRESTESYVCIWKTGLCFMWDLCFMRDASGRRPSDCPKLVFKDFCQCNLVHLLSVSGRFSCGSKDYMDAIQNYENKWFLQLWNLLEYKKTINHNRSTVDHRYDICHRFYSSPLSLFSYHGTCQFSWSKLSKGILHPCTNVESFRRWSKLK